MNEILDNLRHLVSSASAREIGVIKKEQVINIIDSVVQRTTFAAGEGVASVNIKDSVVQRAELKQDEEKKRLEEEERLRKEKEEQEWIRKEEEEKKAREESERRERKDNERLQRAEEERLRKKKEEQEKIAKQGNSIGMKFTLIPAGEFMRGSEEDKSIPVHKVKINNPFYLGTYPVTQAEWKAVMGSNPSHFKGDDLPVEKVSWDDVQEFIKKLNEKEGTDKYRLPSEAEWEYACRAGTTTRYSFGDSESKLGDYAWYGATTSIKGIMNTIKRKAQAPPVGQKLPNPWGLYDMHGNVFELMQDKWHKNYNGAPTDGSAWESGDGADRVIRGGSWYKPARYCRSASRGGIYVPRYRFDYIGFRLLKEQ